MLYCKCCHVAHFFLCKFSNKCEISWTMPQWHSSVSVVEIAFFISSSSHTDFKFGVSEGHRVTWTGPSSQGSSVEVGSVCLGTEKQEAFPAAYWSWRFSFFCCPQLPSSHSISPLFLFPSRWSHRWDMCPTPGHVSLTYSNSDTQGLPEKSELKGCPYPSDTC